jgi:hypothetical protein
MGATNLKSFLSWLNRVFLILLVLWNFAFGVMASPLAERIEQFPQWETKPSLRMARGDLVYPEWMAGTWLVTSTLIDLRAPLAPEIVTPGFAANEPYLNQAIQFQVRFGEQNIASQKTPITNTIASKRSILADRAFNGTKIAAAYLGDDNILSVKVDPDNPNRQITFLKGNRRLVSTITERASETPNSDQFITTEISQQLFRSEKTIYLNEVETTTAYKLLRPGKIEADQITAIYLSPKDPDYFTAAGRPVALYRYHLELKDNTK